MVLDHAGQLVWFRPLHGDKQAFDFRAQAYRGKPVLTWWEGRMARYRGAGVGRIVDSSYRPVATVRSANGYDMDAHELKLTPSGTALVMSYVVVPWDTPALSAHWEASVSASLIGTDLRLGRSPDRYVSTLRLRLRRGPRPGGCYR